MAKYTIELRKVCEFYKKEDVLEWFMDYNLADYLLPEQLQLVENSPIWSKQKLAEKILDHYWMREIGFETIGLFKHYVKITMKEIMEEKLPLIYTACIEYDPLVNVDFTETFEREASGSAKNEGNSNSSSNNNSSGLSVHSDTPQGQINKNSILNGDYASDTQASESTSNINDNTNTTNTGSNENKENYTRHLKGNQGISATYQAMIKQFRDNIIAIDRDIIYELNSLFMGLY